MTKTIVALALVTTACSAQTESSVKRGEKLVLLGGCNDCHTPKNFDEKLHAPVPDYAHMLAGHPTGAPDPEGTPGPHDSAVIGPTFTSFRLGFGTVYARNLTPDKDTGIGTWTADQFVSTMRTGHRQGTGRAMLPPMPWQNMAPMTDEELRAMFDYLQSIPAVANQVPDPKVPATMLASANGETK